MHSPVKQTLITDCRPVPCYITLYLIIVFDTHALLNPSVRLAVPVDIASMIAGGVVGGLIAVIMVVLTVIVLVVFLVWRNKGEAAIMFVQCAVMSALVV